MSNRRQQLKEARSGMYNVDPTTLPNLPADAITRRVYGERALADLQALDALKAEGENEELLSLRAEVTQLRTELETRAATPENALVTTEDGSRVLGRFRLTRTALMMPDDITKGELAIMGDLLQQMHGAMQFWIGDFTNAFHDGYGAMYDALADYFGINKETLENWAWVCRKIEKSRRNDNLSFTHHYEVAGLPPVLKGREDELLTLAAERQMSHRDFKKHIKSLLPRKVNPKPAAVVRLFEKQRAPRHADLRKIVVRASSGDEKALEEAKKQIEEYAQWLHEIAESLGLQ